MGTTIGVAALPVLAALLTTLWTAGGRAALERRAMQQELDIAEALPDGVAHAQLVKVAEDRAALYVHRRVGGGHAPGYHFKMAALLATAWLAAVGLGSVTNKGPEWLQLVADIALLSTLVLAGMGFAFWVTELWRDERASVRRDNLAAANKRLADLDSAAD